MSEDCDIGCECRRCVWRDFLDAPREEAYMDGSCRDDCPDCDGMMTRGECLDAYLDSK